MELDVESAVVGPRGVELRCVLIYEMRVLCTTGTAKVLHLQNIQTELQRISWNFKTKHIGLNYKQS